MERTVSRSELRSSSTSPPLVADDEAVERFRSLGSLEYATRDVAMHDAPAEPEEDEELDFRLFASAKPTIRIEESEAVQKIRLRSPSLDFAEAGFVQSRRGESYYFATQASGETKINDEDAALSPDQVVALSHTPWPGSAYPWKVLRISPGQVSKSAHLVNGTLSSSTIQSRTSDKRKRLGKQARIKFRVKLAKAKAEAEAKSKANAQADEAEREKKTRRNREKKAKKKAREKAKKAAGKDGGTAAGGETGSDSDSDD